MQVATVFSGIGAYEQALQVLQIDYELVFACDIDKHCKEALIANYHPKRYYSDINDIDGSSYLNKLDIIVGGSPCQSFSIAGKREGMEDARGKLIYSYLKLLRDSKPRKFIFENVKGLLSYEGGETFKWLIEQFKEMGYMLSKRVISAKKDLKFPQSRERIFVVGSLDKRPSLSRIRRYEGGYYSRNLIDYIDSTVDQKYNISNPKWQEWVFKDSLIKKAKMAINGSYLICQTARQYASWHGHYLIIYAKDANFPYTDTAKKYILDNSIIPLFSPINENIDPICDSIVRRLTPTECLRLMGFSDELYKNVSSDCQTYKQCGNSIIVPMLVAVIGCF